MNSPRRDCFPSLFLSDPVNPSIQGSRDQEILAPITADRQTDWCKKWGTQIQIASLKRTPNVISNWLHVAVFREFYYATAYFYYGTTCRTTKEGGQTGLTRGGVLPILCVLASLSLRH
jgi:hypothetical protein